MTKQNDKAEWAKYTVPGMKAAQGACALTCPCAHCHKPLPVGTPMVWVSQKPAGSGPGYLLHRDCYETLREQFAPNSPALKRSHKKKPDFLPLGGHGWPWVLTGQAAPVEGTTRPSCDGCEYIEKTVGGEQLPCGDCICCDPSASANRWRAPVQPNILLTPAASVSFCAAALEAPCQQCGKPILLGTPSAWVRKLGPNKKASAMLHRECYDKLPGAAPAPVFPSVTFSRLAKNTTGCRCRCGQEILAGDLLVWIQYSAEGRDMLHQACYDKLIQKPAVPQKPRWMGWRRRLLNSLLKKSCP
jgi:hypothetical protein